MVIAALESAVKAQSIPDLHTHLHLLTALRSSSPKTSVLESMMASIIEACVPVALSGRTLRHDTSTSSLLTQCDAAWSRRFHLVPASLDLKSLLFQEDPWSQSTIQILSAIFYQSGCHLDVVSSWLDTEFAARRSTSHLAQVLSAYLDALDLSSDAISQADVAVWSRHLSRFLGSATDENVSSTLREECSSCICLVLARIPSTIRHLSTGLEDRIRRLPDSSLTRESLTIGAWLARHSEESKPAVSSLIDHGLQWCIRAFAVSDADAGMQAIVDGLSELSLDERAFHSPWL
jgi:hypothetical protein